MECHACGHASPEGTAFCPSCGAALEAGSDDKTVSMSAEELLGEASDDETVSMSAEELLGEASDDETVSMSAEEVQGETSDDKTVSMSVEELQAALSGGSQDTAPAADDADRTVAMQVPPEFFEDDGGGTDDRSEHPPAGEGPRRSNTIFGHPGVAAAAAASREESEAGPEAEGPAPGTPAEAAEGEGRDIDPMAATTEAQPAIDPRHRHPDETGPADTRAWTPSGDDAAAPATAHRGSVDDQLAAAPAGGARTTGPTWAGSSTGGDGPTGTSPPPASGGSGSAARWLVVGLAVLVVAGLVVAAVLLFRGGGMTGAAGDVAAANLPRDVDGAMGVDFERLRDSWVYAHVREDVDKRLRDGEGMQELRALGLEPDGLEALAAGVRVGEGGVPSFAAALRAELDAEAVRETLAKNAPGGADAARDIGGVTFYGNEEAVAGLAGDDTLLSGTPAMMEEVLAVRGGAEGLSANEELLEGLGTVDPSAAFWAVTRLDEDLLAMVVAEGGGMVRDHLAVGDRFAVSVDVPDDLVLRVGAILGDEERAKAAKTALDQGLSLVRLFLSSAGDQVPEAYRGDVRHMLDGIALEQSGREVTLQVTVPRPVIEKALADLEEQVPDSVPTLEGP